MSIYFLILCVSYATVWKFPQDMLLSRQNILYVESIIPIFYGFQIIQIPVLETESSNISTGSDFENNWIIIATLYVSLFAGSPKLWISGTYFLGPMPGGVQGMAVCRQGPPLLCKAASCLRGGIRMRVVLRSESSPGGHLPEQKSKMLRILNPNLAFQIVMTLHLSG